jgi:hypothetical protein
MDYIQFAVLGKIFAGIGAFVLIVIIIRKGRKDV